MTAARSRSVLVTGASTGIGRAVAGHLRRNHFTVFGTVRSDADAEALDGEGIRPLIMDVTDGDSIRRAADLVAAEVMPRGLDGLVNNAGIPGAGPLEHLPLDRFREVLEVNVVGALAVTQACLPMLRAARGRIVNVSSVSARMVFPFLGPYAASKRALEAVSDALRRELYPAGIDVIVVQPGSIRTPLWKKVASLDDDYAKGTPYETVLDRVRRSALRGGERGLHPYRVAEAVLRGLTVARPPARIPVVASRLRFGLTTRLPDRWVDRLIAKRLWRATRRD